MRSFIMFSRLTLTLSTLIFNFLHFENNYEHASSLNEGLNTIVN
jgi:hypothetical protein